MRNAILFNRKSRILIVAIALHDRKEMAIAFLWTSQESLLRNWFAFILLLL